jgi:hypothetical protein
LGGYGGEKINAKVVTVETVFKRASENINCWCPGSVTPGGVASITVIYRRETLKKRCHQLRK